VQRAVKAPERGHRPDRRPAPGSELVSWSRAGGPGWPAAGRPPGACPLVPNGVL